MDDRTTQPAAPLQPPTTDKKLHVTGLGVVDLRPPLQGYVTPPLPDVTGEGAGPTRTTPTGTPFAAPVKRP